MLTTGGSSSSVASPGSIAASPGSIRSGASGYLAHSRPRWSSKGSDGEELPPRANSRSQLSLSRRPDTFDKLHGDLEDLDTQKAQRIPVKAQTLLELQTLVEREKSFAIPQPEQSILMSAHTRATRAALMKYMRYKLRKMLIPLFLVFLSNCCAMYLFQRNDLGVWERWQKLALDCMQNTLLRCYLASFLGFFTGFSLNNAFQRYVKGLDHVQQLSVHLRTGADVVLTLLACKGSPDEPEIARHAEEVVSWVKVYYIQACRGLNSVTLRAKQRKLDKTMQRWEELLSEQVALSQSCVSTVAAHSNIFVSTLQMELLWWRWLTPVLHGSGNKIDMAPAKKSFEAARSSFHAAHLLASGITAPVTRWLLEVVMYLFCLTNPWLTVHAFGRWSFVATTFITFVFFSAQRMSIDLWEPFGIDNPGVVDVELFERARCLCGQLDNMLHLFARGFYQPLDMNAGMHFKLCSSPFQEQGELTTKERAYSVIGA